MTLDTRLAYSLLLLRLGIVVVMLPWTLDKFVNPGHASAVYENFYGLAGLGEFAFYVIGTLQLVLVASFAAGLFRRVSYALVLLLHGVSTLSSWQQYLDPWQHLLFFAAWPMLAACLALYLLRDHDTLFNLDARRKRAN